MAEADQAPTFAQLLDLMTRLDKAESFSSDRWKVLRAVVEWASVHDLRVLPETVAEAAPRRKTDGAGAAAAIVAPVLPPEPSLDAARPPSGPSAAPEPLPGDPARVSEAEWQAEIAAAQAMVATRLTLAAVPMPAPAAAPPRQSRGTCGDAWSEDEIGILCAGLAQGVSTKDLAAKLGRPYPGTIKKVKRLRERGELPAARPVVPKAADVAPPPALVAPKAADVAPPPALVPPKAAPVAPPRPVVAPAPIARVPVPPAPAFDPTQPLWWRMIEAVLDALGNKAPWTPEADLALVEGLARGAPKEVLAYQIGVEPGALKARFVALTPDGVTIEGQRRLLAVLRNRASVAEEAAE